MSDIPNTTPGAPVTTEPHTVSEPIIAAGEHHHTAVPETTAPVTASNRSTTATEPLQENHLATGGEAPSGVAPAALAPVEEKKVAAAEKAVEPITEGQLAYKGPGLIKSLVPSKKEFWLSDAPVTSHHLDLYTRGEKAEVSNPVVAWASQTGKGLLFFNKNGETERTRPHSVLPLYDATDLKKDHPHEIIFRLHGQQHTLKATNDAERDGWFISLERAMEVGKAEKATIHGSESYKSEHDKLTKPAFAAAGVAGAGAAAARSKSHPKNNNGEVRRAGSDADEEAEKKKKKSRSTSRGMLARLQGKKDETEVKREEKKEEKREEKEEKKLEKEEKKIEKEEAKHEKAELKHEKEAEKAGVIAGTGAALDAPGTAERVMGAPIENDHSGVAAAEHTPAVDAATTAPMTDSKKPAKRGSIFGRMQSGFSSIKSPTKEKDLKDAELKPEVPPKDIGVSETAPQIPEPATEPIHTTAPVESLDKLVEHSGMPAEASKAKLDELAASQEPKKSGFLSGLPFMNKRERSVSPSAAMKDAPKKEEVPALPTKDEAALDPRSEEPTKPIVEPATATPALTSTEHTAAPAAEEPLKTDVETTSPVATSPGATSPASDNKRQSVFGNFGNLGRRASKAFRGMGAGGAGASPVKKEENVVPAASTNEPKEDILDTATPVTGATHGTHGIAAEEPTINGTHAATEHAHEQTKTIGDVTSDSVNIGQAHTTPTVSASA
ncbi:hypothetical protein LTR78_007868 [Recurvomyces mirabilis]|uniref:PH domain-containing protein n=1 Tax=Recurvomyces mirabilis TaxID=574656 RepID=A0AAE0TS60_9PEZI|nr:hypothetical protein LTR78_007868 [Recurvomyces mirabilis]KAK5160092.1 hypothetical protein LTS14_002199 [Recurvomyces mirabilis]